MSRLIVLLAAWLVVQMPFDAAAQSLAATQATTGTGNVRHDGDAVRSICTSASQPVDEKGFVSIGGIEQWVTVKGRRCGNPAILFIHGGPGNPNTPYADAVYGAWETDFTLVQWDQRGAGMTYGRNKPSEDTKLTIAQMTDDGVAVAEYARRRLGKTKLILMGSSWGSALAVHMLNAKPDLFSAYVGSSQMVNGHDNQQATYTRVLGLATVAGDADTIAKLKALGAPPWTNPRGFGILRRADRKYEALKTDPAPKTWWVPAPDYATPAALADAEASDDYSYLQLVGLNGDGMFSSIDLPALGTHFDMPFFMIQGSEDLLTVPGISKRYFDSISAPQKEFVLVPRAGHDPNQAMVDAQFKLLKERVAQLAK